MTNERSARTAVRVWLAMNSKSQDWLAQQVGINSSLLSRTLAGYRPLNAALAKKIRKVTGLDLTPFITETTHEEVRS